MERCGQFAADEFHAKQAGSTHSACCSVTTCAKKYGGAAAA